MASYNLVQGGCMADKIRVFISPEIEAKFMAAYDAALQRWPVPYDELYVSTRFGDTHIIASGPKDAIPLVLLNPGGGSVAVWYRNIESLSQNYRTIAVDVIGEMNKSVPKRPITNNQDFIDWIKDLFRDLKIESAHVIGNSNGGFLALNIALHLPSRVKKVVLISPAATFVQMWAWYWHLLIPAHMIAPIIHSERMVHKAYDWLWQGFPGDEEYLRLRSIGTIAGYPRYKPTRNKIVPYVFSDEELQKIRNPVLLLIGDHEVIYKPERVIQRATRLVRGLKAEIIPNANHCAQYTAPDIVNKKILEFLLNRESK
jgi:pimeloyl-ACP methyl ester carboxylesterase